MVRCMGLLPTSFREAYSSAVSRTLRRANRGSGFSFAMKLIWRGPQPPLRFAGSDLIGEDAIRLTYVPA
jgi:hypothetical protein